MTDVLPYVFGFLFALLAWVWAQVERRTHAQQIDRLRKAYELQIAMLKRIADDEHARMIQSVRDVLTIGRAMRTNIQGPTPTDNGEATTARGSWRREASAPPLDNVEGDE